MASPRHDLLTADEFLVWLAGQSDRYELVDGVVVRMMTGAKQSHNVVVSNVLVALAPHAKQGGCRTTAGDTAVRTASDRVRFPDVVVDCGPKDPAALEAARPTVVVEVASPATSTIDVTDKLYEYRAHPEIRVVVLIEPDIVAVRVHRRDDRGGWAIEKYDSLDGAIALPEIGADLPLAVVYDSLEPTLRPQLRLVRPRVVPPDQEPR